MTSREQSTEGVHDMAVVVGRSLSKTPALSCTPGSAGVMGFLVAVKQSLGGLMGVPFPSLVSRHSSWRCALPKLSEPRVTFKPVRSGPECEKHQKKNKIKMQT